MRQCYTITQSAKMTILCDNFLTVRYKIKLPRVISSWKSERKLVKISAQSEPFFVLVLKVSHSKFWLFKPIFRHLNPESGSGSRIRIRIPNPGPNWMRIWIRIRNTDAQKQSNKTFKTISQRQVTKIGQFFVHFLEAPHVNNSLYYKQKAHQENLRAPIGSSSDTALSNNISLIQS